MPSSTAAEAMPARRCRSKLSSAATPSPRRSATPVSGRAIRRPASAAWKRGRGLTMINGLADDVRTVRTAAGTRVTLTFDRAVLPESGLVEGLHDMSRAEFQLQTLKDHGESTPAEVTVTGEVDASNVVEFTRSVRDLLGRAADHPCSSAASSIWTVPGSQPWIDCSRTTRSSSCWRRTASCIGWRS